MSESGGPTTQDGIFYQNSVAALALLDLLELNHQPPRDRVPITAIELEQAEGFEGSYTRDHYAVFFVKFSCKITQFEGFAGILKRTLLSWIFSPMDSFS